MAISKTSESPSHGFHAIVDCYGDISKLQSSEIEQLMLDAAKAAGATVLNSHVHGFGDGCGFTGVVMLAESHISVHTWPETNYAAFDIFMCGKKANLIKAVDVLKSRDLIGQYFVEIIDRGLPPK